MYFLCPTMLERLGKQSFKKILWLCLDNFWQRLPQKRRYFKKLLSDFPLLTVCLIMLQCFINIVIADPMV